MARSKDVKKDPRLNRRERLLGEKESKVEVAYRPVPGSPEDQKGGNVNGYPAKDVDGQMGQLIGTEAYSYPYGDGGLKLNDDRRGATGFTGNSGQPQYLVDGTRKNKGMSTRPGAPDNQTSGMMESQYMAAQAFNRAEKLYAGQADRNPSHKIGALGMSGTPPQINAQQPTPGQFPSAMTQQTGRTLPLQGSQDIQMAQKGMNTGRGGGRNQKTQQA